MAKTSVYIPDPLYAAVKKMGLNVSQLVQQRLLEATVWSLTPGPKRRYEITGMSMPEVLTLMGEADIPLQTACLVARYEHGMTSPGVFLEWTEAPADTDGNREHDQIPGTAGIEDHLG